VSEETVGFLVEQETYSGTLSGLAYALRTGAVPPSSLNLLALVRSALVWFEREADRSLDDAAMALPQVAQVVELKIRLMLPRQPRVAEEDEEDEQSTLLGRLLPPNLTCHACCVRSTRRRRVSRCWPRPFDPAVISN